MGAKTVELTDKNIESTVKGGGMVFIDFWAAWCGPCRAFAPVFESAAEKHADIVFAKVNTDEQQALAQSFNVQGIPTLAIFREGILLFSQAGALPAAALEELVERVRGLDMAAVRAEVESAAKAAEKKEEPEEGLKN